MRQGFLSGTHAATPPARAAAGEPAGGTPGMEFVLPARRVLRLLVAAAVVLVALNLLVVWSFQAGWPFPGRSRFYMDSEANLPTFFSTVLLLAASLLLAVVGGLARGGGDRFALHWNVLALVFLVIAVDEAATLHERLIEPLRRAFDLSGALYFSWVLVGGPVVLGLAIAYLRFLRALPAAVALRFVAAGALYVGGALGLEMLGGYLFTQEELANPRMLAYMLVASCEETLEIAGLLLFVATLLRHLRMRYPAAALRFG